jgi:hypothetical protein
VSKKKILIVIAEPLDNHTISITGAEYLKNYFDITFLLCTDWIWNGNKGNPENNLEYLIENYENEFNYSITLSFQDLAEKINSIKADFIFDCARNDFSKSIQDMAYKKNIKYVLINNGVLASQNKHLYEHSLNFFFKFKSILKIFLFSKKNYVANNKIQKKIVPKKNLIKKIYNFLLKKFTHRKIYCDIAILAGDAILNKYDLKKTRDICWIGSNDFYIFEKKKLNFLKKSDYILYIDSGLFQSNDELRLLNIEYSLLDDELKLFYNNFFEQVEKFLNVPVVIAGHRRGKNFQNYKNIFYNREVIFDKTAELVMGSNLVLANFSTAISFAVLNYKPILFFLNNKFKDLEFYSILCSAAYQLNSVVINADKKIDIDNRILEVDINRYNLFKKNYIINNKVDSNVPFNSFIKKYEK